MMMTDADWDSLTPAAAGDQALDQIHPCSWPILANDQMFQLLIWEEKMQKLIRANNAASAAGGSHRYNE
jgi:hypothetical protein